MTTSVYIGIVAPDQGGDMADSYPADGVVNSATSGGITIGTSSNTGASIELRYDSVTGSTTTNIHQANLIKALEQFRRVLMQRGFLIGTGVTGGTAGTKPY